MAAHNTRTAEFPRRDRPTELVDCFCIGAGVSASAWCERGGAGRQFSFSDKMVNAIKGILITCDIPMAQFLISINDSMPNAHKFIVYMLDDTHIYVQPDVGTMLTKRLQEFRDQNTFVKPYEA